MATAPPVRTPWCILLGSTAGYYGSSVTVILFNKCTAHRLSCPPARLTTALAGVMSSQGFSFPYFVTLMYLVVKGLECGLMQWCFNLPGRTFTTWW